MSDKLTPSDGSGAARDFQRHLDVDMVGDSELQPPGDAGENWVDDEIVEQIL